MLVLGPFQGKVACCRIALNKGVCGTAAATKLTQVVENVHDYPGHISCDSASMSEVVVPLFDQDTVYGVLDVDSIVVNGFNEDDETGLVALCREVVEPCFKQAKN